MKSTLSFNTTNLIIFILLVGIQILSIHGQEKPATATATAADVPPKCCSARHMPVDGKCVEVQCRNEAFCDDKFKSYCTKYNGGQPICRGLSGICGCQGEVVRHSDNNNCPKDQKCNADGKCGPIELKCTDLFQVPVDGKCTAVGCYRDAQCKSQEIQDYCAKFKMGKAFCRNGKSCGCQNQGKPDMTGKKIKCNRNLNASDDCPETEICYPQGFCAAPPKCAFYGEQCDPKAKKCCDGGVFCHKRKFSTTYSCLRTAFTGEPCGAANGGMPCDLGTTCENGICSSSSLSDCYPACKADQTCTYVTYGSGRKRMCV